MRDEAEPLELVDEVIDHNELGDQDGDQGVDQNEDEQHGDEEESFVGFAEEPEGDEEETPLIKRLREQNREQARKLRQLSRSPSPSANDDDPEPTIPPRKRIEDFDYDGDAFNAYDDQRADAVDAHTAWKLREDQRKSARSSQEAEQARQLEQQVKALKVSDYKDRAALVRDRLTDQQMAILVSGADNPAQVIYALGRSETRLDALASEDNLARFAVTLGKMEKEIKVTKRKAPAPESRVRGASAAPSASGSDKQLERLEAEAARTGNRSKLIAYKAGQRNRAA